MNDLPSTDGPEWPPVDPYNQSADPNAYSDMASSEGAQEPTTDAYQAPHAAAEASGATVASAYAEPLPPNLSAGPSYLGNRQDMTAFLAMLAGVVSIVVSCFPCGGCIPPVFALVAGSIALKDVGLAVNPARARQHAIIGIASGLLLTLGLLVGISLYAAFIGAMFAMAGGGR